MISHLEIDSVVVVPLRQLGSCSGVFSEPKDHVYCSVVLFVLCPF
jgi:hypothetical protein